MTHREAQALKKRIKEESDRVEVLEVRSWIKRNRGGHSWEIICQTDAGERFCLRSARHWADWREELFGVPASRDPDGRTSEDGRGLSTRLRRQKTEASR